MKIGDLVRCTWQPRTSRIVNDHCVPMEHVIKDELGIIDGITADYRYEIMFPQFSYTHPLCADAFEVISEQGRPCEI